jgi:acyl dehydratase
MYALVSSLWIALLAALVGPAVAVALMFALDASVPVEPPISVSLVGASPASGSGVPNIAHGLDFLAPVHFGDTVTATVTVKKLIPKHKHVILSTVCTVGDRPVVTGKARMKVPSRAS